MAADYALGAIEIVRIIAAGLKVKGRGVVVGLDVTWVETKLDLAAVFGRLSCERLT